MSTWAASAARALGRALSLFALWMLLVDNLHQPEIVTGVVIALLTAVLGEIVTLARGQPARATPRMLRRIYRPFLLLVTDSFKVTLALLRRIRGESVEGQLRAVRYRATGDDAEDRARRILTHWGASLAANRYAVGIDPEQRVLLVHELVPSSGPLDPLELG